MPRSTAIAGGQVLEAPVVDAARELHVRHLATREGMRLERSRRSNDQNYGPTLYWLFEVSTRGLVSPARGWTLEDVCRYLKA